MKKMKALRKLLIGATKKLFEDRERQVSLAGQQTKRSQLVSILVTPTQFPMLPLLRPLLYLPFIERQKRTKHN